MDVTIQAIAYVIGAYLVGAIPTGYLIAKYIKGIDIKSVGSGNIGATNVTRAFGKKYGALTLVIDLLKGCGVVWGAVYLGFASDVVAVAAFAVLLGNCFSLFLKGKGGKGVATSMGIYLALSPKLFMVGVAVYGVVRFLTGVSGMGSLMASFALPVFAYHWLITPYFYLSCAISFLIIMRHRSNIASLYKDFSKK